MKPQRFFRRFLLVAFILASFLLSATDARAVEQGQMGEISLSSTTTHSNPFDVTLQATFTTGSTSYSFWGFYAENSTWQIRYNLPLSGTWSYTTVSSDPLLDNKTGTVSISVPSAGNRGYLVGDGRKLKWENTGQPYLVMQHTAYGLLYENVPWQTVLDWSENNQFNQLRIDLTTTGFVDPDGRADMWLWGGTPGDPDWSRFNLSQWNKIDEVLQKGLRQGFTFEINTKFEKQLPSGGDDRLRAVRYLAARLGAYPHLMYVISFEIYDPDQNNEASSETTIKQFGAELSETFHRRPLIGIHGARNETYHEGDTGSTHYHSGTGTGLSSDFRSESWLTLGTFHERWKMDGFGILQHRPHFEMPLYMAEAPYESTAGTVSHDPNPLDVYEIETEITNDPRRFMRWYTFGVLLSGGVGVTYGLQDDSIYQDSLGTPLKRYMTGLPDGIDGNSAEGYKDIRRALDYLSAKGIDPDLLQPDDTQVDNAYSEAGSDILSASRGLKRAKFAKLGSQAHYLVYNPYHTDLTIHGIPSGLSIEIFDPQTGSTYSGGQTTEDASFGKPTQFSGEFVLYIYQ